MTIAVKVAVYTSLGIIIAEIVFSRDCKELDMKTHRFWLEAFRFWKGKRSFQYMIPKMLLSFLNKGTRAYFLKMSLLLLTKSFSKFFKWQ